MRKHVVLGITALLGLLAVPPADAVQPCPDSNSCAQVSLGNKTGAPGAVVSIPFTFTQGPQGSDIGQVAAIAFTLAMPRAVTPPLTLTEAGCTPSAADSDLPNAVTPSGLLSGYKLVIENAYCSPSRTHCLCPDEGSGTVPDNFVNVVIYGPNPLPTPGPSQVDIPQLPSGQLFTIDFRLGSTVGGNIPLHVLNQVTNSPSTRPAYTALLSVGDVNAVDQTCGPAVPPCQVTASNPDPTSDVVTSDGNVLVSGGCNGNCDYSGQVSVDDILKMVNIALGNDPMGSCPAGDSNGDGQITVDEILAAVNNALSGCP
jgi:hypothetical protein